MKRRPLAAQVIAVKAPGFGERKTSYLEDIAILTGAQVVKDELGLTLDKVSPFPQHHHCLPGQEREGCASYLQCALTAITTITEVPNRTMTLQRAGMRTVYGAS